MKKPIADPPPVQRGRVPFSVPEVRRSIAKLLQSGKRMCEALVLRWIDWRRVHQEQARICHVRRTLGKAGIEIGVLANVPSG